MDASHLLQAYAAHVAHRLGKDTTTTTTELLDYGRRNFTPLSFLGVFPADITPERTRHRCFYIQNTAASDDPSGGEHWCAIAREPGRKDLLFDSFAWRPSPTFMPHLQHARSTDPDVDQALESTRCGQLCLGFGHVLTAHGYHAAMWC